MEVKQGGYSDASGLWWKQDEYLACLCWNLVPNCGKIGYKLKNEDQVEGLGVILTSLSGNCRCIQYTQTHALRHRNSLFSYVPLNNPHLSPSEYPQSSAGPQSHISAKLVELCNSIFSSQMCAHKLSVNVFLSHILESRKSIYRQSVVRRGEGTLIWVALLLPTVLGE